MERSKSRSSMEPLAVMFFFLFLSIAGIALCKSTIEPCSGSNTCSALVGYTLYVDLKVSEVGALFQVDPAAILAANSIDFTLPDATNSIFPSGLFLRVPTTCSCSDGMEEGC